MDSYSLRVAKISFFLGYVLLDDVFLELAEDCLEGLKLLAHGLDVAVVVVRCVWLEVWDIGVFFGGWGEGVD